MEDSERRKAIELLKEMRSENKSEDEKHNKETRLNWMYKGPSDLVDKEEYLLGKAIDKTFEILNSAGNSNVTGRTGEQSNVPKRLLEKTDNIEQVDIAKKILEDPLYAIKQKEMEARKKLLNNPVKLKQIKQMLLERNKQNNSHKKKKKKMKNKTEQDLNELILKKLRMFTDKEKRKALSKIMKYNSDSSSVESSSSDKKNKKHSSKRKRFYSSNSDESDSKSECTSGSEESDCIKESKKKKRKSKIAEEKLNRKCEQSESSSSDCKRNKTSCSKKLPKKKHISHSSSDSDSDSSGNTKMLEKLKDKSKKDLANSKARHEKSNLGKKNFVEKSSERHDQDRGTKSTEKSNSSLRKENMANNNYGLMMPDGSKPERRRRAPEQKHEKKIETKGKFVPPPKARSFSEKEREEKLKEMIENAKLRKEDREKNLANHRKKLALEEESKTYDDDFMRRQMLHLTSQGTMADRIKSNINNIQRSKSSMDTSFLRK